MSRRWGFSVIAVVVAASIGFFLMNAAARDSLRSALRQIPYVSAAGKLYYGWRFENFRFPDISRAARGDGGAATEIYLQYPMGLAEDAQGRIYVADRGHVVWRIDRDGQAHIVAGTGNTGDAHEQADARQADLGIPEGLCIDDDGGVYFADSRSNKVLKIETDGRLVRVAGTGRRGYSGDGGRARDAELNRPFDVAIDDAGRLFIADYGNDRVRVVEHDGVIRTFAGTGEPGRDGDGGPAELADLREPYGLFLDSDDQLVITDSGNHVLRRVDRTGIIRTIAGTGADGYTGDGGRAEAATFSWPQGGAVDEYGSIYVNDEHNHAIRVISPEGTIGTLVGTGRPARALNGVSADGAALLDPEAVLVSSDGSILISEGVPEDACSRVTGSRSDRAACAGLVRSISTDGRMGTFAGRASLAGWE